MRALRTLVLAAAAGLAALALTPGSADAHGGWYRHGYRHGPGWGHYHRPPPPPWYYRPPPAYHVPPPWSYGPRHYVPPPVYYAPPPRFYGPPPGVGFGIYIR